MNRLRLVGYGGLVFLWMIMGLAGPPAAANDAGLDALRATRTRPLFSPTRRPPPVVVTAPAAAPAPVKIVPPPPPPPPPPSLDVTGIIIGPGICVAIVKRPQDAKPMTVAVGAAIDGWVVVTIAPREIVLRQDSRTVTVKLFDPKAPKPPPAKEIGL